MSMTACLMTLPEAELNSLLQNPDTIKNVIEKGEATIFDLDKSWHGIHFLLTGSAQGGEEPLCYLIEGGHAVGDIDVGSGPARALKPDQVAAFDAALNKITEKEFRTRFNPEKMRQAEIYPSIWDRPAEEDDSLQYLVEYLSDLKTFVREAKEHKQGILVWLS